MYVQEQVEKGKFQGSSLRKKLVHGVFWLGAANTIGQAISWVITIYVVRILSPDDYGLMGMSLVFIGLVILNNELGLGSAIVQKKDLVEDDLSSIYWITIFINIALYLFSYSLAPLIAAFFNESRLTSVIRVIALTFLINSVGFISYYMLTREMLFKKRSIAELLGNLSGSVSTLLFAINGFGVWSLVYGRVIIEITKTLLLFVLYPFKPKLSFSFYRTRSMIKFGLQVVLVRFLSYIYLKSDIFIAGKILGKTLLGYYSLALTFASLPLDKIVSLITQAALPAFSEIQDDNELSKKYFLNIVRFVSFVTFPIFSDIFLISDDAVYLFLTEKWSPIILPLKVLCIASCFRAINAMYTPLLIAKGKPDIAMKNQMIFAILLPVGFYIGSFYGLKGLSYSWLLVFPVAFLIVTIWTLNIINISLTEYVKEMKHIILGTIFMILSVKVFQEYILFDFMLIIRIVGTCLISILSYFTYYVLFHIKILNETKRILKMKSL